MARFLKKKTESLGKAPGELIFVGEKKVDVPSIRMIDYNSSQLQEQDIETLQECMTCRDSDTVTWININGLHDLDLIRQVGESFDIHSLTLEDILNTGQRPKMEDYDNYLYFALKMMNYDEDRGIVVSEHISIVMGNCFLITFQERPGDVFEPVRERIRKQKGRVRNAGIDYLAYTLLDTIIDNYIYIIERIGEQVEDIEDQILDNPDKSALSGIYTHKRELNYLRKSIRPAREFILQLSRYETELIHTDTRPYLKDLLDLSTQAVEIIDTYRDMLTDHLEIYNTLVNNRLNEIMKVLTIFSAVFIPLTFIAGIYGTNFEYLPELRFRYAYYIFWGVLVVVALTMLRFFKKKKWL